MSARAVFQSFHIAKRIKRAHDRFFVANQLDIAAMLAATGGTRYRPTPLADSFVHRRNDARLDTWTRARLDGRLQITNSAFTLAANQRDMKHANS